jgi:hypothetical protein
MTARGPRKVLFYPGQDGPTYWFDVNDFYWERLERHIPAPLVPLPLAMRRRIARACRWFINQNEEVRQGGATAAATRRHGKKGLAPLERYAKAIREATEAWQAIMLIPGFRPESDTHHPLPETVLSKTGEDLLRLAKDAEWLLNYLRAQRPLGAPPAWPVFVNMVASVFSDHGFAPKWNGRSYEGGDPDWFQHFLRALNEELRASRFIPDELLHTEHSKAAFDASVTAALRKRKDFAKLVSDIWAFPSKISPDELP